MLFEVQIIRHIIHPTFSPPDGFADFLECIVEEPLDFSDADMSPDDRGLGHGAREGAGRYSSR